MIRCETWRARRTPRSTPMTYRATVQQTSRTAYLGSVMNQGGDHTHSSDMTLPQLMNQAGSTKRTQDVPKSVRKLMNQ